MSVKIVKDKSRMQKFVMSSFSLIEKGTHLYEMRPFSFEEESAVQDSYDPLTEIDPPMITAYEDEITDDIYLPPSRLAKAEDNLKVEHVSLFNGDVRGGSGFLESPLFADVNEHQEQYPTKIITSSDNVSDLENGVHSSKINELESVIAAKELEIENVRTSMASQMQTAIEEASTASYAKAKAENDATYTASKTDYFQNLETFNKESLEKIESIDEVIKSLDEELPKLLLTYIEAIIGQERKLNDKFVINLIKKNLGRLNDYKTLSFSVNPEDLETVKNGFPNHVVSTDSDIPQGSVRVNTNAGDVELNADKMIEDLKEQLREAIGTVEEV